jgi:putative salt-induced outer membrane protein
MKRLLTFLGVVAALVTPVTALGDEENPAESRWAGSLGLAYLATSGNSDTSSFGLDFKLAREPDPWGVEVFASFERADQDGERTAERYFTGIRGQRELSQRWQLFTGLTGERDRFAGFDLEMVIEAGTTYKVLLGPVHDLSFDLGATWTDIDRMEPEPSDSFIGAVLGLAYSWKISDNAAFTQGLMYYPNFDDSGDWRATSETGIEASISSRLAIRLSYGVRYRHEPIGERDSTDTTTKASLVFKM